MKGLIVVGACYLDTILTVSHYPGEDEKLRASTISHRRGGNGPNTLEVLSQLLHHPCHISDPSHPSCTSQSTKPTLHLLAPLPHHTSPAFTQISNSLPSISLTHAFHRPTSDPAASYIIRSLATSSRTIVNHNPLPEMTVGEFEASIAGIISSSASAESSLRVESGVGNVQLGFAGKSVSKEGKGEGYHVHFEGRVPEVTLQCIRHLRAEYPGVTVSVECEKPDREGLRELAVMADLAFYSRSWAVKQGYESALACVRGEVGSWKGPLIGVCTWGEGGSAAFVKGEGDKQPWEGVVEAMRLGDGAVVDTVGAGDTVVAGVLYALITQVQEAGTAGERKARWSEVLKFANRLAGMKVQREGFEGLADDMFRDDTTN